METIKVDILNPKARKLLNDLADLDLIAIRKSSKIDFSEVVKKLRATSENALTENEIAQEVEAVRSARTSK
ncbi:hypothetical protein BH23BAC3_BH23BAC3_34350 [soil metagenome]